MTTRQDIQERKYAQLAHYFQTMPSTIPASVSLGPMSEMQASVDSITVPLNGLTVPSTGFKEWLAGFENAEVTGQSSLYNDSVQWAVKVKVDMPRAVQRAPYQPGYAYPSRRSEQSSPWKRIQYLTAAAILLLAIGVIQTSSSSGLFAMFV